MADRRDDQPQCLSELCDLQNWIDTSKLGDSAYSSSEEIYQALLAYIEEYLADDSDFDKLLYEYLIKSGSVTGTQICAIVYEQGVLPMEEDTYNGLLSGSVDSYSWLYDKIKTLKITPGQLGLEPGSGGLVVTDPNTGDVLACVSYPGYDNNRLANTMDSSYYNQLNSGTSRPFYNRATQERLRRDLHSRWSPLRQLWRKASSMRILRFTVTASSLRLSRARAAGSIRMATAP